MQSKQVIIKCCVCGRERDTEHVWNYRFTPASEHVTHSLGVCGVCYQTEIMKIRMRSLLPAVYS